MKSISKLLIPLLLGMGLALAGFAQAQIPDPQAALTQAVAELQKNPADSALREKIIKMAAAMDPAPIVPEEAERFMARGGAAFKAAKNVEDLKDAVSEFEKATLAAPWLADAYNNLGVAQDKAGQYDAAILSLRRYLLAAPGALDVKAVKSLIYEIEYRRDKAAKEAQLAAEKAAEEERRAAEEQRNKAEAEQQRQAAEAKAQAEQERRNTIAGEWQVTSYMENGASNSSQKGNRVVIEKQGDFYRVTGLDEIFDMVTYRRVNRLLTGTATPLFAILKEHFKKTPEEVLRQAEGKVSIQCSLTLSDDGLTLSAERDNCAINYSRTQEFLGGTYAFVSIDRVPSYFVFVLTRMTAESAAQLLFSSGDDKFLKGNINGAIEDYSRAITLQPYFAAAFDRRGWAKFQQGDLSGAVAEFSRAIEINPGFVDAFIRRGHAKASQNDFVGSIADFSKAIELRPNNAVDALINRGLSRFRKGDSDGALADFSRAIESQPNALLAYQNRGCVRAEKGDCDGAIADFSKCIELQPNDASGYINRGLIRRVKGDFDNAIADSSKAIKLSPGSAWAFFHRGAAKYMMRDYRGAIVDCDKALKLEPRLAFAYSYRGLARSKRNDFPRAFEDCNRAVELAPNLPYVFIHRALVKMRNGDHGGASEDLSKAAQLKPQDVPTQRDLEAAISECAKAAAARPNPKKK